MPLERVQAVLRAELGPRGDDLQRHMEPEPVAAASIGQVHRAVLADGRRVAVKVQYPDVEQAIRNDFRAARMGPRLASMIVPGVPVAAFVEEARRRLLEECDYRHEAESQVRFAALYRGHDTILVPAVHPEYVARRVLVTTFVEGQDFQAFLDSDPPAHVRDRIGQALFEFYVGTLFRHGVYHCDPHPGNYVFPGDGRVAILDYGCTRTVEPAFVAKLARLTRAVQADDADALGRALADLGILEPGPTPLMETARGLVRSFYGPMLRPGVAPIRQGQALELREVLAAKRDLMRLRLPAEFLFLFRIRFGLLSVLAALGARGDWHGLEAGYADHALADRRMDDMPGASRPPAATANDPP